MALHVVQLLYNMPYTDCVIYKDVMISLNLPHLFKLGLVFIAASPGAEPCPALSLATNLQGNLG